MQRSIRTHTAPQECPPCTPRGPSPPLSRSSLTRWPACMRLSERGLSTWRHLATATRSCSKQPTGLVAWNLAACTLRGEHLGNEFLLALFSHARVTMMIERNVGGIGQEAASNVRRTLRAVRGQLAVKRASLARASLNSILSLWTKPYCLSDILRYLCHVEHQSIL